MKSISIFVMIIIVIGCSSSVQNMVSANSDEETKPLPENVKWPEPIGGIQEMMSKLEYPILAQRKNIQGHVFVEALVDTTGKVTSARVTKGIGGGCDEEAIRVVKLTKFIPAEVDGEKVDCTVNIPILFKLEPKKLKIFF